MTAALWSTNSDWYAMRASGFVTLAIFTASICLGVANLGRVARGPWTRTVAALVHRNLALLGLAFLALHVVTAISDRYVKIPAVAVVVPGPSGYDPLWTGLGALAFDLVVAVALTSVLRARLGPKTWQVVHWLSYLMWPLALVHSVGSGSGPGRDTGASWSTLIYVGCGVAFAVSVAARLWMRERRPALRSSPPRVAR